MGVLRRRTAWLALSLAVLVCGCKDSGKSSSTSGGTPGAAPAATPFRVALLTPGSIRDGGWNQSAYEGLERIQ